MEFHHICCCIILYRIQINNLRVSVCLSAWCVCWEGFRRTKLRVGESQNCDPGRPFAPLGLSLPSGSCGRQGRIGGGTGVGEDKGGIKKLAQQPKSKGGGEELV